jgi:[glutamine synthetase] adenylyltransferase / [glutamine synthetase]-adenylyl-L-tyrosine phosphorylase
MLSFLSDHVSPGSVPCAADPEQAQRGIERWSEATGAAGLADFARQLDALPSGRALLRALFGNSSFLTQCCLQEPGFLRQVLQEGPDGTFAELVGTLNRQSRTFETEAPADRGALAAQLRIARRRVALLVAVADIAGAWDLEQVTGALSAFAEAALGLAIRHLLAAAARSGEIELADRDDIERGCGLIVLGMGKLGARELNYSSDIDLILLFDRNLVRYVGKTSDQQFFARLARDLVKLLEERTAQGYVFRTDLRLRPDPASTPPVVAVDAALGYYESTGQNWERAALIKARPVAGDRTAGAAFLAALRPFLWRKHLDFAAIQDIHSIKRQINAHRGGRTIAVAGHNIKLGRGGIREIEFFAQTQQLIWGGRLPELRVSATCEALRALVRNGRLQSAVAEELILAYGFLRRVEHRLQMVDDAQTHTLPSDAAGLQRIAAFLGFATESEFAAELRRTLSLVEKHYAELFEEAPSLSDFGNLVFTGFEDDPDTLATLTQFGFAEPSAVAAAVRGWHHGRYRATHSQRAREILTELVPGLLTAFGASANPDAAFHHFDSFLGKLPAGVQFFSLLHSNPPLLALLAEIMGGAPRLAAQLARHPILLDSVLSDDFFGPLPHAAALTAEFARLIERARDYSEVLDLARRWTNDRKFQIGVNLLRGLVDGGAAGSAFADLADAVIAGLLPAVMTEFARQHGTVPGGEFAVVGLGKLGGREMTVTSDLDLIMVYDAPAEIEVSDGARKLPVATYYARLSQRLINALTALTGEGLLYEVDMRLRPSGSSGPIASSFAAFRRYHDELAWTWEHMALTRARAIAGGVALRERVIALVGEVLHRPRDPDRLVVDVAEMRERMAAQHPNPSFWDIKHRRGGLVDVEFIAQYLMLRHAAEGRDVVRANTSTALAVLAESGGIAPGPADELSRALRLWQRVQGILKLLLDGDLDEASATPALKAVLARGAAAVDFERLKPDMTEAAASVLAHYRAIVAAPAAACKANVTGSTA